MLPRVNSESMKAIRVLVLFGLTLAAVQGQGASAQPTLTLDLAALATDEGTLSRVYGYTGTGRLGVPVAGGFDLDGDGNRDYAVAFFTTAPLGRGNAGEIDLILGEGNLGGVLDTAAESPSFLRIFGAGPQETAGNEIWMDDVTGDGLGDLLIARQNMTPEPSRPGAGALTILVGSPSLRRLARGTNPIDLAAPPPGLTLTTLLGADAVDRFGIWMRTGDVDGDGIADIVVGADQEDLGGMLPDNPGAVYVVRGGSHLASGSTIDLRDFGSTSLAGHIAKIVPPPGSAKYHFGSTCLIADLDGNGRGEVLMSAALARGGASVMADGAPPRSAEASGGTPQGTVAIAWDDNFPDAPWPTGLTLAFPDLPGSTTLLDGGAIHRKFGEELLGGLDYDDDGNADLFVGDLLGGGGDQRPSSGVGHVFYDASSLKGLDTDFDALPAGVRTTTILGPSASAIGSDTGAHGDFDGDGIADLAVAAPYANPLARSRAGVFHVFFGQPGGWPDFIDTRPGGLPPSSDVRVTELQGGQGAQDGNSGDTIGYSAAAADLDGDGRADLVANEMLGDGLAPSAVDTGNLILVSGAALSGTVPSDPCPDSDTVLCLNRKRFAVETDWRDFNGQAGPGRAAAPGSDDSGLVYFFNPDNWEILVKVLDGCSVNGHFWVFAAATTNVEYTLRVTDTLTGDVRTYVNPLGTSSDAVTDTTAFANCP